MVHHRLLLIAVATTIMGAAACAPVPAPSNKPLKAADFEAAISRLEEGDPQSPQALDARLEYADFLSQPGGEDCQERLTTAQSQVDTVAAKPAVNILPLGPARMADVEYKIHLARATCGGDHPPLKDELQQALKAAGHAIDLYRGALDYQSAAIMQFNVAAAYDELGDGNDAVSALKAAIAMDREYGFRQDAEDNSRLLLRWQGGAASDSDVAAVMKDFPTRSAEFKFHWSGTDANVAIHVDDTTMVHGEIVHSQGAVDLKRHILATSTGWTVSSEPGQSHYELGDWPADTQKSQWSAMYFMARALFEAPTIAIGSDGDFKSVAGSQAFGTGLATNVSTQISAQLGQVVSDTPAETEDMIIRDVRPTFSQDFIDSTAMQDYGIQTGTWIGAKLDQGVWYQMSTPLFLPVLGLGHYFILYDVNFAFTRQVPCSAQTPDRLCAEIVVHATPDANALKSTLEISGRQLRISDKETLQGWSVTDFRLVVDPDTLLPYISDTRHYVYDAVVGPGEKSDPLIESIRTLSASVYH